MADVVELSEWFGGDTDAANSPDEETAFLVQYAPFLAKSEGRMTLKERCEIVKTIEPDDLILLDDYIETITQYGVSEYGTIKCKECKASTRVSISFDALTFLPGR